VSGTIVRRSLAPSPRTAASRTPRHDLHFCFMVVPSISPSPPRPAPAPACALRCPAPALHPRCARSLRAHTALHPLDARSRAARRTARRVAPFMHFGVLCLPVSYLHRSAPRARSAARRRRQTGVRVRCALTPRAIYRARAPALRRFGAQVVVPIQFLRVLLYYTSWLWLRHTNAMGNKFY
jgi:hypothetical protein